MVLSDQALLGSFILYASKKAPPFTGSCQKLRQAHADTKRISIRIDQTPTALCLRDLIDFLKMLLDASTQSREGIDLSKKSQTLTMMDLLQAAEDSLWNGAGRLHTDLCQ